MYIHVYANAYLNFIKHETKKKTLYTHYLIALWKFTYIDACQWHANNIANW